MYVGVFIYFCKRHTTYDIWNTLEDEKIVLYSVWSIRNTFEMFIYNNIQSWKINNNVT